MPWVWLTPLTYLIPALLSLPPASNLCLFSINPSPFFDYAGLYLRCSSLKHLHGECSHFGQIDAGISLSEADLLTVYGLASVLVPCVSELFFFFIILILSYIVYLPVCLTVLFLFPKLLLCTREGNFIHLIHCHTTYVHYYIASSR